MVSKQNPDPPPDMRGGEVDATDKAVIAAAGGKRRWHVVLAATGGDGGRGFAAQ